MNTDTSTVQTKSIRILVISQVTYNIMPCFLYEIARIIEIFLFIIICKDLFYDKYWYILHKKNVLALYYL